MNNEQLLAAILQNIHDSIFALDSEFKIAYINPSAASMCASTELVGKSAVQVFTLLDPKSLGSILNKLTVAGQHLNFKDAIFRAGGNTLIVDGSITTLGTADIEGYVIIARDVSEKKKLYASLDFQASHDTLTGLVNREGFVVRLDELLDTIKKSGDTRILMQINIDNFKRITNESGAAGGNAILIQFAELLKTLVRESDTPARVANDIFTLIHMGGSEASALAGHIHKAVEKTEFTYTENTYHLTVSIGVVQITGKAAFAEALMSEVDKACASAKKAGGNTTFGI
jgi:diguanylate cyclase (GGDEF)-like protein/PAS domain S-box-containing protein